jgi:hypothetical protein
VVVRQSKRDARLESMMPFELYIGAPNELHRSYSQRLQYSEVSQGVRN